MENKKQTAVEWLVEQFEKYYVFRDLKNTIVYQQAKAIEQEQIENAWNGGIECTEEGGKSFDQYYKETYEK